MNVLEDALNTFGTERQIDKCIEELLELATALMRYKYKREHNTEEEIADVLLTVGQMQLLFDEHTVNEMYVLKLQKLEKLIKEKREGK